MDEEYGNVWDYWKRGQYVVIPTNGVVTAKGECVMGAGIAKTFSAMYPEFPAILGRHIQENGNHVGMFLNHRVFSFPVKEHFSDTADLKLISRSADELRTWLTDLGICIKAVLPLVGCGRGRLSWDIVQPVVNMELGGANNIIVIKPSEDFNG